MKVVLLSLALALVACSTPSTSGGAGGAPATSGSASSTSSTAEGPESWPSCGCALQPSPGWTVTGSTALDAAGHGDVLHMQVTLTKGWPLVKFFALFTAPKGHEALPAEQPTLALARDGVPLGNVAADVKTVAVYEIDPTAIAVCTAERLVSHD